MSLPLHAHIEKDGFRLRGLHFSRVDAFSDVVFGFAITLLVVSLEVPHTFPELHKLMLGFMPFAISFTLLMIVWFQHYKFFRRFPVHDVGTIWINGAMLFVVLFYTYPLKFLFTFLTAGMMGHWDGFFEDRQQFQELMVLYGLGFALVYGLLAALYLNAYRQREHLELTTLEQALTRNYIVRCLLSASTGVIACLLVWILPLRDAGYANLAYWLIMVFHRTHAWLTKRKLAAMRDAQFHPPPLQEDIEIL